MKILILGDIVPTDKNYVSFEKGKSDELFHDVIKLINNSDISVANLECPYTNSKKAIIKSGPSLKASTGCFAAVANAGIKVLSLANNHIMDYGECGIHDTIAMCKKNGIKYVGAGSNASEAKKLLMIKVDNKKIGFYSLADNECSSANERNAGSNGFDPCDSFDDISACADLCDYLIVLYHSGIEHYQYPSPMLQRMCRKMVEKGALAVICQHSHCIGCYEDYLNGFILYGQGNCLFAKTNKDEKWNTGLAVEIEIKDGLISKNFFPTCIHENASVSLMNGALKERVYHEFLLRTDEIKEENRVTELWNDFNANRACMYYSILLGFPKIIYILNKLLKNRIAMFLLNKRNSVVIANIIRCESHRESILKVMEMRQK